MCFLLLWFIFEETLFMPLIERFSSWPSLKLFDDFSPEPPPTLLDQPLFLLLFLQVFQHVGCSRLWWGSQGHQPCCECSCYSKSSTVVHNTPSQDGQHLRPEPFYRASFHQLQVHASKCFPFHLVSTPEDHACSRSIWLLSVLDTILFFWPS